MCRSLNDINSLQPITNQKDGNIIKSKIVEHIKTFQFEDSYINNSGLKILEYSENVYHSLTLDNFSDNRFFTTEAVPNVSGYQISRKFTNEFNPWDYHLTFNKEFSGSNDSRIIEESHHAQGCSTCNQHGKLRCYACNGAGENTCSNCYGKGQLRCSNCDGRGETRCFWCSGKGTKTKTEYRNGQSYSTQERCSHCSGRGNNPCSSCRGGYVNCSTCSATGKVACYVCMSSGEITCHTCEGYKTLDNYFIVNTAFKDQSQELIISQPSAGYNLSKAVSNNFQISNLLLELIEPRFKNGHFESLNSNKSYSTIVEFFNFVETPFSKLIKSRLAVFENTYNRIKYEFYGETYDIFFDKNFQNYYYNGRKPSDQYEIDLLKRLIQEVKSNSLIEAKTTLEKFSQSNFLNIGEQKIVDSISFTENIYEAVDLYSQKKYTGSENIIKNLPEERTKLSDVKTLKRYLNRTYFFNTTVFWLVSLIPLGYLILTPHLQINQYINGQGAILFSLFALFLIYLTNIHFKNINFSRYVIVCINLIICGLIAVKFPQQQALSNYSSIDSANSSLKTQDTIKNTDQSKRDTITPAQTVEEGSTLSFDNDSSLNNGNPILPEMKMDNSPLWLDGTKFFEDENGSWICSVNISSNKDVTIKFFPGNRNNSYQNKSQPREMYSGIIQDNKIKIFYKAKFSTTFFKYINGELLNMNNEGQYNRYKETTSNTDASSTINSTYMVTTPKAFFYNSPADSTLRKGYLLNGEIVTAEKDSIGFIYVEFTNKDTKKTSKGWIKLACLNKMN